MVGSSVQAAAVSWFLLLYPSLAGCGIACSRRQAQPDKLLSPPVLQVCADTFRAGAFDQLKQNATKAQVQGNAVCMAAAPHYL
jgi:hypothetical protein